MQVVTNNFVNNYCHKLEVFDDRKVVDKNLLTLYKARCVRHKIKLLKTDYIICRIAAKLKLAMKDPYSYRKLLSAP